MNHDSDRGGYRSIHAALLAQLRQADIAAAAEHLDLARNAAGEAEIPFCGRIWRVSNDGVRRPDGPHPFPVAQSVLIHYLLQASRSRPAGQFVALAELAGPLFAQGSYSASALERPVVKRFQGRVPELLTAAAALGGRQAGEGGLGSLSLVFDVLPHILLQLIFYDRDEEFPARATLLFDRHATRLLDFETLAVAATLFVAALTKP